MIGRVIDVSNKDFEEEVSEIFGAPDEEPCLHYGRRRQSAPLSRSNSQDRDSIPSCPRRGSMPRISFFTNTDSTNSKDTPPSIPTRRNTVRMNRADRAAIMAALEAAASS